MRVLAVLIVIAVAGAPRTAAADPVCTAGVRPAVLRAQLEDEAARTAHRRLAWSIGYGAVSVGQLAIATTSWNPSPDTEQAFRWSMYVGAAKSAIGAVSMLVAPRLEVPDAVADPCADAVALRAALARNARLERVLFWGSHIGGLVVNLAGTLVLAKQASWSTAALSFAIGYPIGLLNTYSMPRDSWHAWRELSITPVPVAGGGASLVVGGTF